MIRRHKHLAGFVLIALLTIGLSLALSAEGKVPAVIGNHIVIQQGKPVSVGVQNEEQLKRLFFKGFGQVGL